MHRVKCNALYDWQRGGLILSTLFSLFLVVVSFTIGYLVARSRYQGGESAKAPTKIEDVLRRELQHNPPVKLAPEEVEFYEKLKQEEKAKPVAEAPAVLPQPKEPAPLAKSPAPPEPQTTAVGDYTIQLGAFRQPQAARSLQASLKKQGVMSEVKAVEVPGKGRWWRVHTGRYATVDSARQHAEVIQEKTGSRFLVRRVE